MSFGQRRSRIRWGLVEGSEQIFEKNAEKISSASVTFENPVRVQSSQPQRTRSTSRYSHQVEQLGETCIANHPQKSLEWNRGWGRTEHPRTNLPGHATTQPDLSRGLLPIFTSLIFVVIDHVEHDSRGELVVCLATTLGCLKDMDGIPRTTTLSRLGWC